MYGERKDNMFINSWIEEQEDGEHFITRMNLGKTNPMIVDTPLTGDPMDEYKHYDSVKELIDIVVSKKLNK